MWLTVLIQVYFLLCDEVSKLGSRVLHQRSQASYRWADDVFAFALAVDDFDYCCFAKGFQDEVPRDWGRAHLVGHVLHAEPSDERLVLDIERLNRDPDFGSEIGPIQDFFDRRTDLAFDHSLNSRHCLFPLKIVG